MALLVLVFLMCYQFLNFGNIVYNNGAGRYKYQQDMALAAKYITDETRYADTMAIFNTPEVTSDNKYCIFIDGSGHFRLIGPNKDITIPQDDQTNEKLSLTFWVDSSSPNNLLFFKIIDQVSGYSISSAVYLENIDNIAAPDSGSGIAIDFTKTLPGS